QAAGELQRREGDLQEAEDVLPEQREDEDDAERDGGGLPGSPASLRRRHPRGQAQEDRHGTERVHDDEQREERRRQQGQVDDAAHGRTTGSRPSASIRSSTAVSVSPSPNRLGLPAPW